MGTSSANPYKLGSYSSDGLDMLGLLALKATAAGEAADALNGSGSAHVPNLGEAQAALTDLVADWKHLDEFVGDVANGFLKAAGLVDRPPPGGAFDTMVLTASDSALAGQGQLGYADRDVAVAEARRLADDLQVAMEDGSVSREEMEALAQRAERGMYDPAFAVTFTEGLGVEGTIGIPALIEASWPGGEHGDNAGWGQDRLVPFATVLTTAMDTRASIRDIDRHDPSNRILADEDRLSEDWVEGFTSFDQPDDFDQPNDFHQSLLLAYGDLPAEVLVNVANTQVVPMLARQAVPTSYMNGYPWGTEDSMAELNVLNALGDNRDASLSWLGHQSADLAVNNMALVLEYDPPVGYVQDNPRVGQAFATVVDNGLGHWDDDRTTPLFEVAVDAVAAEGELHFDELAPVLGEGARSHVDVLAHRTNEMLPDQAGLIDESAQDPLYRAHDFLKVVMADDDAAESVYRGALEYVESELGGNTGEGLGGESRNIGGLMGLVTEADENAAVEASEQRVAARQSFLRGIGMVKDVVGLVPVGGQAAGLAVDVGTTGVGWMTDNFGMAGLEGEVDQAYADMANVRDGIRAEMSSATAAYQYGVAGAWSTEEVMAATDEHLRATGHDPDDMDTDFFVDDGEAGGRRSIKPYEDMSEDEQRAYNAWLSSDQVNDLIAYDRTVAGQRMDEVAGSLERR